MKIEATIVTLYAFSADNGRRRVVDKSSRGRQSTTPETQVRDSQPQKEQREEQDRANDHQDLGASQRRFGGQWTLLWPEILQTLKKNRGKLKKYIPERHF